MKLDIISEGLTKRAPGDHRIEVEPIKADVVRVSIWRRIAQASVRFQKGLRDCSVLKKIEDAIETLGVPLSCKGRGVPKGIATPRNPRLPNPKGDK